MKPKKQTCENCNEELTRKEIEYGSKWCFDCDLPERQFPFNTIQKKFKDN